MILFRAGSRFFYQHLLLSIILLAFLVRFAAIFVIGNSELQHEYAPIVLNLAAGRGFVFYSIDQNNFLTTEFIQAPKILIPSAFKSPVYPIFLAFFVKLFGAGLAGMRVIETIQALLGSLCCWLVYKIVIEKFGKPQALLAAVGMAFYPLLVYSSTQISDTIIFLVLEILTFWLFIKLEQRFSAKILVAFSICFGLFMLARPEGFLYFPLFLLWLLFRMPGRKLYAAFAFMILSGLVILPWGLRNYSQMGKFTMNTSGGFNLWEGQNKDAVGVPSWYVDPPIAMPETLAKEISIISYGPRYEVQQDDAYLRAALQDMRGYPAHAIELAFRKLLFFWTSIYFGINFAYPGARSALYWLPWLLMAPFFLYGIILAIKEYKKYLIFFLSFIVSTFTCVLFFVLPRYTMLVYPWVIIFAAQGLWHLYQAGADFVRKASDSRK